MGEVINNSEIFKKLGFNNSNQWIFYDERFQRFFSFLGDNMNDKNILTEHEVLEHEEMVQRGEWLEEADRSVQLQRLVCEHFGLLKYTDADVATLSREIELIKRIVDGYATLIVDMRDTKHSLNSHLSELEYSISTLQNDNKELMTECQFKAKTLEELQRENCKLNAEAKKCFTKIQSPPLFMHQMPLEQYFLKCDSFMQYFTLYIKENFKLEEYLDFDCYEDNSLEITRKLENLEKSMQHYTIEYIKEKGKVQATQVLIDNLDLNQIHVIGLSDIKRETHELELFNEHHLKSTYETLLNDLAIHAQQRTQQRIELVLLENTKLKLERAYMRRQSDKRLSKIISDALSNAELLWIAIQFDLEKRRNRTDSTDQLQARAQSCSQRIQTISTLNSSYQGTCTQFVNEIAKQLSSYLGYKVRSESKFCLYEYEKFCRLLVYALQSLLNKKSYTLTVEQLNELNRVEEALEPFVYDSPVSAPMFENVRHLRPMFKAKIQQHRIEKLLRNLRIQFQEQITDRMANDKLWRYSQLLWIWFLTDPKRLLHAIDEVKKSSAKIPTIASIKPLGGIKRK